MDGRSSDARRRRLVRAIATGLTVGLAGCLGDETTDAPDDEAETREVDPDEFASHDGDGPEPFPEDHRCNGVCGMRPVEYPDWHAQLAHADGSGAFFCTPGCLVGYLVAPDHVGAVDAAVDDVWVTDFETGDLVDGGAASFVLVAEGSEDEPMGINPRTFAAHDDAVAYADRRGLPDDAVIGLDEFDLETARRYREHRLPEPDE